MSDPFGSTSAAGQQSPVVPPVPPEGDWPGVWAAPDQPGTMGSANPGAGAPHRTGHRSRLVAGAAVLVIGGLVAGVGIGHGVWRPGLSLVLHRTTASAGAGAGAASSAVGSATDAVVDVYTTLGYQGGQAAGTGIVLTSNGQVLTNHHVIAGSTSISVTDVGNGQSYPATVVGYDKSRDLAVLQLRGASGLTTAPLGDATKLRVGDPVMGIGNAGGAGGQPSQAAGSVTALDQSITAADQDGSDPEQLTGLIQVDAAIQPGDSGGPLVNSAGQVVGIDTAAAASSATQSFTPVSTTGGGGEGYAIPINQALSVAQQIEQGQASATVHLGPTAFLGVQIAPSGFAGDPQFGAGTSTVGGALVDGVLANTAAAQAGLTGGDLITAVNGQPIDSPTALSTAMAALHPGDTVTLQWTDQAGTTHTATGNLTAGPAA